MDDQIKFDLKNDCIFINGIIFVVKTATIKQKQALERVKRIINRLNYNHE